MALNYTNPMAMLCRALQGETKVNVTGLCHSVQGTAEMLARWIGLIDNLPEGCCVKVPVLASKRGLDPIHVGPLPGHLAILNNVSARCEELAVEAAIMGDRRKVFHAICMDPLTSAVLSLAEIQSMVDELFEANKTGFELQQIK